jgi:hypothetical protein
MDPVISIPDDHDQRFKALIREFFADFLRLFFADWAARFNLSAIEWLDTEILPNPPEGSRHRLDLVAQLQTLEPIQPDHWIALVHIEIESPDRITLLKPRLPSYYLHLSERYGLPVLPIVLYLQVAMDGIGISLRRITGIKRGRLHPWGELARSGFSGIDETSQGADRRTRLGSTPADSRRRIERSAALPARGVRRELFRRREWRIAADSGYNPERK